MKYIILILSLSVIAQSTKFKDEVVAEVDGKKIYKSALIDYHQKNLKVVKPNKKVSVEASLNDLINRKIGIARGTKNKIHKSQAVIRKINDIVYHAQISKDLAPKFEKIGEISDSEAENYCKKNPEYRTSQILFRLRANPSKEEVAKALDESLGVYNKAKQNPEKFNELAKSMTQAQNALAGGDLGFQPRTRLTTEFYAAINGKKIGYITKPFRTQYGMHVVKVTGKKDCKDINKNLYKKIVYDIKRDKIIEDYFSNLRTKAKVKIYKSKLKI